MSVVLFLMLRQSGVMTELEANYKSFQLSKLFPTEVNKIPLLPLTNTTVQNAKYK